MSSQSTGLGNGAGIFACDFKYAVRWLTGAKGLTITVVLTYCFWTRALKSDPSVIGRSYIRGIHRNAVSGWWRSALDRFSFINFRRRS